MTDRLTPTQDYVAPGVYIGERFSVGSPNVNPETRVATYVGRGSRYIRSGDQTIRRGFLYDVQLSFSTNAPHIASLSPASAPTQQNASLVDSKGTEVRKDLWMLVNSNAGIQIADSAYDPTETYSFSYQSADSSVPDPLPTSDLRVVEAIGSQISQDTYKRNTDYFIDCVTLDPAAAKDETGAVIQHTNDAPVFSAVSHVGTGTGEITLSASALFTHKYSRSYKFTVRTVTGTAIVLEWTATPTEFGNDSLPSVPVAKGLASPVLGFDTTNPQSLTLDVELGIRIDAGVGTYVVGDTYAFTVSGPSLLEVDSAFTNTNQFASASPVVLGENNTSTGSLVVNAENYSLSENTKFVMHVTNVDTGVTIANVPYGSVTFSGNPKDSEAYVIENGQIGSLRVVKSFEFTSDSLQSIPGSSLVNLASTPAVASTGSLAFLGTVSQAPNDGDTVTLTDGTRTFVFEFDIDGVLNNQSAVRVIIDTTAGQQSARTAANLVTAVNASTLTITATDVSSSNSNIGKVNFTHGVLGSVGNNTILTSRPAFISVSGFSGGKNVGDDTNTTIARFVTAINDSFPRLGIVASRDVNNTNIVSLIHGGRYVFTGNPAENDTVTVSLGSQSSVFEFVDTATPGAGNIGVDIGATLADTMNALVTAIATSPLGLVAAASVAGGQNTVSVASSLYRSLVLAYNSTVVSGIVADVVAQGAYNNGNKAITTPTGVTNTVFTGMSGGIGAGDAPDVLTLAWGTAGDVFTGGTLTINETTADKTFVPLYGGVSVKLSKTLATAARGAFALNAVPVDGDTVVLNDHIVITPIVYTFRTTATLAGDIQIVSGNAIATAANLRSKIRSSGLAFNIPADEAGKVVSLTHTRTGSFYNTGLSTTSSVISVTNLVGGGNNYAVGDVFSFTALAPRKFSTALDTRKVRLTVGTVGMSTPSVVDPSYVFFGYSSNTPEGGFGNVEAFGANKGYITLPGQISLVARNSSSFVRGDVFDVEFVNNNVIYWTLDKKTTEVVTSTSVLQDRNGAITGNAGSFYAVLRNQPYVNSITSVQDGVEFTGFRVVPGTSVVILSVTSAAAVSNISFSYTHRGSEPGLGTLYYITAQYIRPASMYNAPRVFYSRSEARAFLEPVTLGNDLAIANEVAFDQAPAPKAVAFIQVRDADEDGVFSPTDIDNAIASALGVSFISDITPVNLPNYTDKFQAYNINACDPFERKEHLMYFGLPIGTNVGSELEEGSIVFTAKRTLQVYGKSPAHGTRVLVGSTMAKKAITLSDGSVVTATLDGSFIAAAIAARIAGMTSNASTILRSNIYGFSYIETFNETVNNILGAASVIYFAPNGTNTYQIMEDVTVDTQADHYNLLIAMKTKHDSVRIMRREMDRRLVGFVADTKAAGVGFVQSNCLSIMLGQVGSGVIAPYQDASGNLRQPSDADVLVKQDESDPTLFHFLYGIFTFTEVKRLYGVYTVNEAQLTGSL